MRTRDTVLILSVCQLPVYCLLKTFNPKIGHTIRFFPELQRFSTKGFCYKVFFLELLLPCVRYAVSSPYFFCDSVYSEWCLF